MSRWQCCSLLYGLNVSDTILSYTEKGCLYIGRRGNVINEKRDVTLQYS